jgi:hypothetical protein
MQHCSSTAVQVMGEDKDGPISRTCLHSADQTGQRSMCYRQPGILKVSIVYFKVTKTLKEKDLANVTLNNLF